MHIIGIPEGEKKKETETWEETHQDLRSVKQVKQTNKNTHTQIYYN